MLDLVDSAIILLSKGMSNRKLYFSDHPRVESYAYDILDVLNDFFRSSGEDEMYVGVITGFFVFEGKRVFGPSVTGKQFIDFAHHLHCGGFGFQRGVTVKDLKNFFDISALRSIPAKKLSESRALFKQYGVHKIRLGDPFNDDAVITGDKNLEVWEGQAAGGIIESPTLLFQELFDVVSTAHGNAALDRGLDMDNTRSVCEFMLRYIQKSFADVMQFVHYPDHDTYTVGHSVRVASLAVYIGTKLDWPEKDLLAIGTAGLLHDIGKSKIPESILMKKGQLNDEELAIVQRHPQVGAEMLLEVESITPVDLAACWGHHIRHDRGGYPQQPSWAVLHPVTALLHICDVFEALTAIRPYKPAMEPQQAYTIMINDKGNFHPGLLASFMTMIGLYPPGTYVRLSDRRVGMVTEAGRFIDRPHLLITTSKNGEPLGVNDQYMINLSEADHRDVRVNKLLFEYID